MNDWHIISDNVCTKIDVLHDLFNIREGNISCDGFTGEEINFMIYAICVHCICIIIESACFFNAFLSVYMYLFFIYVPYLILCTFCMLCIYMHE